MTGLPGSIPGSMPAGEDETQRRLRDIERRLDELAPSVARSFAPQIDFLANQTLVFTSSKGWSVGTTSGTGAYNVLAYDPTYDDEYVFQASSTGLLKIGISARVMLNNNSATAIAATSRGYQMTWNGGSAPWSDQYSAVIRGSNCGISTVSLANTALFSVPPNATVTLRTIRAILSPVTPDSSWHGTVSTTIDVTRIGV